MARPEAANAVGAFSATGGPVLNTKSQLLKILEDNKDSYISGEELAKSLAVSRNAVWKAMNSLRADGYSIPALTNRGYRLDCDGDILSAEGIGRYIKTDGVFHIETRKTVTSTNTVLRELAGKGAPEGYVLAANEQTGGRGRLGRNFYSPAGHGVYFSLLLRPGSKSTDASLITSAAAVAVARAVEEVTGVKLGIKWVNDLYTDGKKVCGILTEATYGIESGIVETAILGIGINVTRPDEGFPGTLKGSAGAIHRDTTVTANERCRLVAATLDNFRAFYKDIQDRAFLEEYRERSIILGKDIYVINEEREKPAAAIGIDDDCGLIVRYEDGKTATLRSGEVSIRQTES